MSSQNKIFIMIMAFLSLFIIGCTNNESPAIIGNNVDTDNNVDIDNNEKSGFEKRALSLETVRSAAEANNLHFRVVSQDGKELPVTRNYIFARINATVKDNIVTDYSIEGCTNSHLLSSTLDREFKSISNMRSFENDANYTDGKLETVKDIAEKNNVSFRIVSQDGEGLPITLDYSFSRINAVVDNNIVTQYSIEGCDSDKSFGVRDQK